MSWHRMNIIELTNHPITHPRPIFEWNELLNYFEKHKDELDIEEVRMLDAKSEEYRQHCNASQITTQTIEKNGKSVEIPIKLTGMEISPSEVNPNISEYLRHLEAKQKENYNKESLPAQEVAVAQ